MFFAIDGFIYSSNIIKKYLPAVKIPKLGTGDASSPVHYHENIETLLVTPTEVQPYILGRHVAIFILCLIFLIYLAQKINFINFLVK
jgi:hypothetical protein